jgi:hypothetical protein
MPYIKQKDRVDIIRRRNSNGEVRLPQTAGELNYAITLLLLDFITKHGKSYQTFNDITGAIENCKLEFYRRVVAPYEDIKIQDNGDVY